ncbi:MAG: methylaspartate mutase accessory protein GlmL [Treponema sp.]|nr:methylaspartate mutase accessory protein GlmL [Treponema sp.]
MKYYLTADFGSTFTKVCAVDAENKKIAGTAKAFTTINTDVREGYLAALEKLEAAAGKLPYSAKLACSSAGGGLRMIAAGLVPELTAKAAGMAASSAGAKVIKTYSYEISSAEQAEIYGANPDILLLCGGTDGGNREVIIRNAKKISQIKRDFAVIYAGNKSAADEAKDILSERGREVIVCGNVMPVFNVLNIDPAKQAIRELFIRNIISAKGLSEIQKEMTAEIIPTPLAVMEGAALLSKGFNGEAGIGEFMAIDVGGATTDVYTMARGEPSKSNTVIKGLPEPFEKRTVEGDLGLRYNIDSLAGSAVYEKAAEELGLSAETILDWVDTCGKNPETISAAGTDSRKIDEYLSRHAVKIAAARHCGTAESVYTALGETIVITGKDLSNIPVIIGTGGPLLNSGDPVKILGGAVFDPRQPEFLKPINPKFFLDKKYIFASMGLTAGIDPETALKIMKDEITEVSKITEVNNGK